MIYPLDEQLERLMESFTDEETGELTVSEEALAGAVNALQMDFDETIKSIRNSCLTDMLDAECINAEAAAIYQVYKNTKKGADAKQNRAERKKRLLAYLLKGEKFDKDGVRISYRKSEGLVIDDAEHLIEWAAQNAPGFLKEPALRENDIKTAIKSGADIPFAHIETRNNIQVK